MQQNNLALLTTELRRYDQPLSSPYENPLGGRSEKDVEDGCLEVHIN